MGASRIEWTESTWNPITGCTKVSPGCQNCYAEKLALRLKAMGQPNYANGFKLTMHDHVLAYPLKIKRPRVIFVNSMSDLFHENVPLSFIQEVFKVMNKAHWHTFQVLTKRSDRLQELSSALTWGDNIWMGVSVEDQDFTYRIDHLRNIQTHIKFLSLEPLLGPLPNLNLFDIDWVVVGGESGSGARRMDKSWVENIRDQCIRLNIPFFFKQWGGVNKKKTGRTLDGRTWDEMPTFRHKGSLLHQGH